MSYRAYAERPPSSPAAALPLPDGSSASAAADAVVSHPLGRLLDTINDLSGVTDLDDLWKSAVILARDRIGLKRAVLFSRDPSLPVVRLRGSWAIDGSGIISEVHHLHHECSKAEHAGLLHLHQNGRLWRHDASPGLDSAPWLRRSGSDWSWVVATPLMAGKKLMGLFYNGGDGHTRMAEAEQIELAVLCGCLAVQVLPLCQRLAWRGSDASGPRGAIVERVRSAINETPKLRGAVLAQRLGLSSGHLARSFKREVGVSLVEYRHRVLLERFFAVLGRGRTTLLDAATEAGFGSYAQFHRVYRRLMGAAPYESLTRGPSAEMPGRLIPATPVRRAK